MTAPPRLFDRALIARRLDRAVRTFTPGADFLLARAADELADRLTLVNREFADAAEIGAAGPHGYAALVARRGARSTLRYAPTPASAALVDAPGGVADLERPPLAPQSLDLVVSLLALHVVNDLPGALIQLRQALRPDGLLIAALIGGDTLNELRQSLTIAESEITGGAAPRVIPFVDVRAMGGLLQRAGLSLPVVDADRATVRYRDMFALMRDLRAFGAANSLEARSRTPLRRAILFRAQEVYAERFADADGRLRATFDTLWISGWAPHDSQPKPLKPGSAAMRLGDALAKVRGETPDA
jgi:SAM-dependent methyltransferase